MKKNGKYRFSLQFSSETDVQRQVGDFLEHLGNRKSAMIVEAVFSYLQANPGLSDGSPVVLKYAGLSKADLEETVRKIISEHMILSAQQDLPAVLPVVSASSTDEDIISSMLDNLSLFQ